VWREKENKQGSLNANESKELEKSPSAWVDSSRAGWLKGKRITFFLLSRTRLKVELPSAQQKK
jgi:hypothetical protein